MAEIKLNVPEGTHIRISRFPGKALDLEELVYSHVLLPVRATFGPEAREAQFEWTQPEDWIKFCNGEKIQIIVRIAGKIHLASIRHGEDRVVYVKKVVEA